jgi:hypothetical protein
MLVTILPPQPPRVGLSFDEHQFYRRRKAVKQDTGISFGDYRHMSTFRNRGGRRAWRFAPVFVNNAEQLRNVLAKAAWQAVRGGRLPIPKDISLAELKRLTENKLDTTWKRVALDGKSPNACRHFTYTNLAGGWLERHAAIAYLSWKLGYPSTDVAAQLHTTPQNVRIILYRLCNIARKLGYETFKRGHSYRGGPKWKKRYRPKHKRETKI